jgi:hypothetical protein
MLKHSKTQLEKLIRQRAKTDTAGIVFTDHAKKEYNHGHGARLSTKWNHSA